MLMDYKSKIIEIIEKIENQELITFIYGILIGYKGKMKRVEDNSAPNKGDT